MKRVGLLVGAAATLLALATTAQAQSACTGSPFTTTSTTTSQDIMNMLNSWTPSSGNGCFGVVNFAVPSTYTLPNAFSTGTAAKWQLIGKVGGCARVRVGVDLLGWMPSALAFQL